MQGNQSKTNKPSIPREDFRTLRQAILELLERETLTAREISAAVKLTEKDVVGHLEHIRRASLPNNRRLEVIPPQCRKCGFIFRKRERLTRPGRCPVCRSEHIAEPLYTIS